ncbi:MAG: DUF4296 domain-containing protein [Bacteroidia bacterium]|nr:DUF4296 domain-containing protein [Bacteroidia bacterium]
MRYILVYLVVFITACSHPKPIKPDAVWSDEKLISVLTDIEIADAALTQISITDSLRALKGNAYYNQVFKKHGVTANDFKTTMDWYAAHPRNLSEVYTTVLDSLSKMQSEVAHH